MTVRRIVPNLAAANPQAAQKFYRDFLELDLVMDQGWILTFAADGSAKPQLSVASQGGSGTEVPTLSIEVDDVDAIHNRAVSLGLEIVYAITDEPWGVRRFYVRDPFGNVINLLSHI
ncbi:MAG: putative enzyme related to lactoylglutathione lyase [Devosia sp.]|uniref:VOC family protein n=1 Tax=Devosia sp. TaxID=1871048 RepID=UPI00260903EA|nr:VOC family protein [Devosia sp.]MDB5585276.1 putative enzyme related to lactoylglutathione lyase [Devosia sp.]